MALAALPVAPGTPATGTDVIPLVNLKMGTRKASPARTALTTVPLYIAAMMPPPRPMRTKKMPMIEARMEMPPIMIGSAIAASR